MLPACEWVFAGQTSEQADGPGSALNFPAGHREQGPPSGPEDPAAHRSEQSCEEVLPGGEVYPEPPQGRHDAEPEPGLYFPESHIVQGPPLDPEKPPAHTQLVSVPLPRGDSEPDGHETHVDSDVAAKAEEKVSLRQLTHAADPGSDLYFPARHCTHVPPVEPVYPASHVQSESWELPAGELELEPHDVIETPPVQ
jgi:hypothetical protein